MQDKLKFPLSAKFARLKRLRLNNPILFIIFLVLLILLSAVIFQNLGFDSKQIKKEVQNKLPIAVVAPTPVPTPTPTPTPRPLTFSEMNTLYGPCVNLPTLMYHHIQTKEAAVADKQTGLTVYTDSFKAQMQYLKDKGYNVLTMNDLINFFDNGVPVSKHSVLITFDDGYEDFYTDAYPILSGLGFHATMFIPTGLMENPDYMTWNQLDSMKGFVLFANHTWSHKNVQVSGDTMRSEISTADTQLSDHRLNSPKVFAYPYGLETSGAESYLASLGYKLAFTTVPGNTLCKQKRFALPRIRIGSASLSSYGF